MQKILTLFVVAEAIAIAVLLYLLFSTPAEGGGGLLETGRPDAEIAKSPDLEVEKADTEAGSDESVERVERTTSPERTTRDPVLGTVLVGRVTGSDGKPVEGHTVYIRRDDERRGDSASTRPGGYAAPGFRPGKYSMTVRATGYKPLLTDFEIEDVAQQRFDVTLQRARMIRVAVVDGEGKPTRGSSGMTSPFGGFHVVATESEPPTAFPMTNLRSAHRLGVGRFRDRMSMRRTKTSLPEKFLGVVEVDTAGPVWIAVILRQQVLAKKLVPVGVEEVEVVVTDATVRASMASAEVRVVAAESGQPLKGARVSFSDRQSGGGGRPTDENGNIKIENLVPGILEFEIRAKDRESYHSNMRIHAGKHVNLGVVRLSAARTIEGRLVDDQGEGVAGVSLEWIRRARYADDVPFDRGASARSGSDGKFKLWGCGAGRYFVRAVKGDLVGHAVLDATAGDVTDAVLRMLPGRKVTWTSAVPRDKILLVRILEGGRAVRSFLERPYGKPLKRETVLPAGRYDVQILEDSRVRRAFTIDLRRGPANFLVP